MMYIELCIGRRVEGESCGDYKFRNAVGDTVLQRCR